MNYFLNILVLYVKSNWSSIHEKAQISIDTWMNGLMSVGFFSLQSGFEPIKPPVGRGVVGWYSGRHGRVSAGIVPNPRLSQATPR